MPAAARVAAAAGALLIAGAGLHAAPAASQLPTPTPTPEPAATPTPTPTPAATPTPAPAAPAPAPAAPAAPIANAAPTPTPAPDLSPPTLDATILTRMRSSLTTQGLTLQVHLSEPGSVSAIIRDGRQQQISKASSGRASMPQGGSRIMTVKLTPAGKARARRTAKVRWTVEVLAYDGRGNATTKRLPFKLG